MAYHGKNIKVLGICPRCEGTGKARAFNRYPKYSETTRRKAEKLWDTGMSLREIAKILYIKHPQTIKNILSYKKLT
jgi:hypothetical protein